MYYKDAQAAILMYDCTQKESFTGMKKWVKEMEKHVIRDKIILVVAGNKCDLVEQETVDMNKAKEYADSIKAKFYMTSAKFGTHIEDIFMDICSEFEPKLKSALNTKDKPKDKDGTHKLEPTEASKKKNCC